MNWINLLIILGCLAAGYWIVSSIMSPGVDLTRPDRQHDKSPDKPAALTQLPATNPHVADWYLILDVPANAERRDVERAYKRRLAQAEATGDQLSSQRIRLAYAASAGRSTV